MASENTYTFEAKTHDDVTTITIAQGALVIKVVVDNNACDYYAGAFVDVSRDGKHVDSATVWANPTPADKSYCELVNA